MRVLELELKNFRNIEEALLIPSAEMNVICGENAQGKTNLLESIYYCSTTKTHRNVDDVCCIYEGYDSFKIEAELIKKNRKIDLTAIYSKSGKHLYLYRNPVKKVSDFIGFVNAVIFSPNDMNLFSAQPKIRRKFMDIELSKCSKTYMFTLNEYYRVLKQRNAYLKNENINRDYLYVLDEKCAELQSIIIHQRYKFLQDLMNISLPFYEQLSLDHTKMSLAYKTFVNIDNQQKMKEDILKVYEDNFDRDLYLKTTEKGIHKDDFKIMINEKEAEEFGAFIADQGAEQCGFCNPGFMMNAIAMFRENPYPSDEEILSYWRKTFPNRNLR